MLKTHRRSVGMIVLLMLATSSLSATYSFAEPNHAQEGSSTETKKKEKCKKSGFGTILTEKIVDGKLEVQQYAFSNIITKEDLRRTMQLDNQASNWAYVCNAYNSGIVLFDGKASKLGDDFWRNSSELTNYELPEWKEDKDTGLSPQKHIVQGFSYQIIFSGNTGEIQENELFMTLSFELSPELKNDDNCVIIEGFQSDSESINHNKLVGKSI